MSGAISAPDLVRSLERDVAGKIPGCDLADVVAAALEATPDKRKRDLLSKARYALRAWIVVALLSWQWSHEKWKSATAGNGSQLRR